MPRLLLLAAALCAAASVPAYAASDAPKPSMAKIGVGRTGVFDSGDGVNEGKLEYRPGYDWMGFIDPFVGLEANLDGGLYGLIGIAGDLNLGRTWIITPSIGVGLYHDGGGRDLGGPVEFRTGLELAYRLSEESSIGLEITHTSNADIYSDNPGTEAVTLNYHFPIDVLSR